MPKKKLKSQKSNAPAMLALFGMSAAIAALGIAVFYNFSKETKEVNSLMCPVSGPRNHVVVVIDKTEKLNFTQRAAITTRYENLLKNELGEDDLLSVFNLTDNVEQNSKPIFQRCHPGDGSNKSELTDNLKRIQNRYQKTFIDPALSSLTEQSLTNASDSSPIIETLQIVSIQSFQKHNNLGKKRLILVSDMLQHSLGYSMYRNQNLNFSEFSSSAFGKKSTVNLRGVEVEINYVFNYPDLQTKRNALFWEELISAAGGSLEKINKIEG